MSRDYRARHHKYFAVDDERDVILDRHQQALKQATVVPTSTPPPSVASNLIERAAAAVGLATSAEQTKPLVGLTPETEAFLADAESRLQPYVPVVNPHRKIRQLPAGTTLNVAESFTGNAPVVEVQPPLPVEQIKQELLAVLAQPIGAQMAELGLAPPPRTSESITPADPLADMTLADLPIGKSTFEFLNGTAGTGKTTLARKLMELMPVGSCVLAATTGIAAVNLGEGTTINALLGFFNTEDLQEKFQNGRLQSQLRRLRASGLRRIILDEVSMMASPQVTMLVRAIDEINSPKEKEMEKMSSGEFDDDTPVGELPPQLGLTLVGDFAQLPPVPDKDAKGKPIPVKFAFESPEWKSHFEKTTVRLTKIWRQDNRDFVEALHAVRRADAKSALQFFTASRFSDMTDMTFDGTTIFAKNDEVDRHNQLRLDTIAAEPVYFEARRWGKPRADWKNIPDKLQLKPGALVMILANRRDPDSKQMIYANGDLGELVSVVSSGAVQVRLKRNGRLVNVVYIRRENLIPLGPGRRKEIKEYDDQQALLKDEQDEVERQIRDLGPDDPLHSALVSRRAIIANLLTQSRTVGFLSEDGKSEVVGSIEYLPVRVAYACTCHKTQGLTLDKVQINIRDPFFRTPGMLFVALSRCRTAEGLRIVGNQIGFLERCKTDGRVLPWL